jgi:hypothetical protein
VWRVVGDTDNSNDDLWEVRMVTLGDALWKKNSLRDREECVSPPQVSGQLLAHHQVSE